MLGLGSPGRRRAYCLKLQVHAGEAVNGTLYGQSVNLIGDGQLTISQMGYPGQGGGRVFVYELQ